MDTISKQHMYRRRLIISSFCIGLLCISLFPILGKLGNQQAHADFLTPTPNQILPPTNVGMLGAWVNNARQSTLVWTASANAAEYAVYMNDVKIASKLTSTSYVFDQKVFNSSATFTMTATDTVGNESIPSNVTLPVDAYNPASIPNWVNSNPPPIPLSPVTSGQWNLGKPRIFLSWQADGNAQLFRVYRDGKMVADGLTAFTFIDSDVTAGATHTYTVSAVNNLWPSHPESTQSLAITGTAPLAQAAFSSEHVSITKVVPNDDSATVFFNPIPGAVDYRIYNLANLTSTKYAGYRTFDTNPANYYGEKVVEPAPYSIEMNGINAADGADLVLEAVDKFGPFQKMDGFAGPGSKLGTSINGQSDPSNVPNVVARSQAFHVTSHPFTLAGSQVFFDTFRGEQPLVDVPTDPNILAWPGSFVGPYFSFKTQKNDKWSVTQYATDTTMTRNFIMGNHFMDTIYDGPTSDLAPFSHNNNASNIIAPVQTADISGGKVLHITMEVDGHFDARRWTDIFVGAAGDTLVEPRPTKLGGNFPTISGNLFALDIFNTAFTMEFIHPDPADLTKTVQTDLIQAKDWTDGSTMSRTFSDRNDGINGSPQDLDKRHTFDLFLSTNHYKLVETAPDGAQISREKDFPAGYSLPFSTVQVYYVHELYHTANDIGEVKTYSNQRGGGILGPSGEYWYNYRPYSDERHWDNMGFSVLNTFADAIVTPLPSEAPNYIGSLPTPTPSFTPTPSVTPTPTVLPTNTLCINLGSTPTTLSTLMVQSSSGAPVATVSGIATVNNSLTTTDVSVISKLTDSASYTVTVTPQGYLPIVLTNVTHLISQCASKAPSQRLIPGDYNGNGKIDLGDLVAYIHAYNQTSPQTNLDQLLFKIYAGKPTFQNLSQLIYSYNQQS